MRFVKHVIHQIVVLDKLSRINFNITITLKLKIRQFRVIQLPEWTLETSN